MSNTFDSPRTPIVGRRAFLRIFRIIRGEAREVWLRFFAALAGLALAFAAALFSTVARESGSFWATLFLSGLALILAVMVGIYTLPVLARRVAGSRLRDAIDYEVTRVGILYVAAVLVIGIAALNTGNNLLYIVVSVMLAAILISGIASAFVLRQIDSNIRLPEHIFAGESVRARVLLRNRRRWFPSFSISAVSLDPSKKTLRFRRKSKSSAAQTGVLQGSKYFPLIPAGGSASADFELTFPQRGRHKLDNLGLQTRFPFAFIAKTRRIHPKNDIIVFPGVDQYQTSLDLLPSIQGEWDSFRRGQGHDLFLIREYAQGDSVRHVDWKATARSGSLKVRELRMQDERRLRIVFDNPVDGELSPEKYERAVMLAASVAWFWARQESQVCFAVSGQVWKDVYDFLAHLASIVPASQRLEGKDLAQFSGYNLVITGRNLSDLPASLQNSMSLVQLG